MTTMSGYELNYEMPIEAIFTGIIVAVVVSQIAAILGVSVVTVKSWEHERRNIPKTVNNFLRLSIAQVPTDKLKEISIKLKNS